MNILRFHVATLVMGEIEEANLNQFLKISKIGPYIKWKLLKSCIWCYNFEALGKRQTP